MSEYDEFEFGKLERRRARELEEVELRQRERRELQRASLRTAHRRRRAAAVGIVMLLVAGLSGAWSVLGRSPSHHSLQPVAKAPTVKPATTHATVAAVHHAAMPTRVRGIHVGIYPAGQAGTMDALFRLAHPSGVGLNTVEIDVKDENGEVGFGQGVPALAHRIGAVKNAYDPDSLVREAHAQGLWVIGRIVAFEDPILASKRPSYAIRTTDGGVWRNAGGLGWTNEYDPRVWSYLIGLGRAAARHGFDEIQFDYVRFPTDGPIADAVWPHRRAEPMSSTIARFLATASKQLHKAGVKVSANVFGLAAHGDLGIGQNVRKMAPSLDAISPMAYPSHYGPGEYGLPNPDADPFSTVAHTMGDFRAKLLGVSHTQIRPWLQDFTLPGERQYTLRDVLAEIRAAENGGASGWLLWNADSSYTTAALGAQ